MFFEDSIKTPITDDYVIIQELGRTLHSVVKKARNKKNGELVAIKFLDKNKIGEYEIVKEVAIMKELEGHPGVIRLKDVYETPNEVILVLEYASGGELFDKIQELNQYSEKDAQVLFQQIASIVQFLHSKDIVHRDLKPENLLFVDEKATTLKLADFGTAEIVGKNTLLYATVGSPGYMAPEVLNGSGYSKPADIFSLGVILVTE
jgi:serine/threonine protein kinase